MKSLILTLAAMLIAWSAGAKSSDKYGHDEVRFDPQLFAEQQEELTDELKSGERYAELSNSDRRTVLSSLNDLDRLMSGISSIDELTNTEKLQVFNLQETINTLLTEAAKGSRLICERTTKTGTHRPINVCKTVAQREREREDSVNGLRGLQRAPLERKS